jgi:hypothetical protein
VRAVAAARNQDWDRMSDEERDAFIDDIMHEALYYRRTGGRPPFLPKNRLPKS